MKTETQEGQQVIVIQPANPQVVYVPTYNPTVVYGTPYYPPGYSTGALVATGVISFGVGMAVGAAMSNSWGWNSWGCGWHGGTRQLQPQRVRLQQQRLPQWRFLRGRRLQPWRQLQPVR